MKTNPPSNIPRCAKKKCPSVCLSLSSGPSPYLSFSLLMLLSLFLPLSPSLCSLANQNQMFGRAMAFIQAFLASVCSVSFSVCLFFHWLHAFSGLLSSPLFLLTPFSCSTNFSFSPYPLSFSLSLSSSQCLSLNNISHFPPTFSLSCSLSLSLSRALSHSLSLSVALSLSLSLS